MEEEDWGVNANAPSFCLFKYISPEEAAAKDGFVDNLTYGLWKKHERRTYRRLRAIKLNQMFEASKEEDMNELINLVSDQLSFLKEADREAPEDDKVDILDALIAKVEQLKITNQRKEDKKILAQNIKKNL